MIFAVLTKRVFRPGFLLLPLFILSCGPKAEGPAAAPALPVPEISSEPRTAGSVNAVIGKWHGPIQFCYRKAVRKNPAVQGRVIVRFTIAPEGSVREAEVVSATVQDKRMVECVRRNVERLRFPPVHESLGSLTVTYPFTFGQG